MRAPDETRQLTGFGCEVLTKVLWSGCDFHVPGGFTLCGVGGAAGGVRSRCIAVLNGRAEWDMSQTRRAMMHAFLSCAGGGKHGNSISSKSTVAVAVAVSVAVTVGASSHGRVRMYNTENGQTDRQTYRNYCNPLLTDHLTACLTDQKLTLHTSSLPLSRHPIARPVRLQRSCHWSVHPWTLGRDGKLVQHRGKPHRVLIGMHAIITAG